MIGKIAIWLWFAGVMVTAAQATRGEDVSESEFRGERRPNILFILTDDQGPWAFGASGNPDARTPHLDQLALQGGRFVNAFCPTPVCSPARASLLSGRYGSELGILDWIHPQKDPELGLNPALEVWPRLLQSRGYATALFGKWHLGNLDRHHPSRFGYDTFFGFRGGGVDPRDAVLEKEGKTGRREGFVVELLTEEAIQWIRSRDRSRLFLASVHFREPHAAYLPVPEEDWRRVKDLEPGLPFPRVAGLDEARARRSLREYYASVAALDRNVGRLLAVLDAEGLADSTLVVFTSDHGYNLGHHGLIFKGNAQWMLEAGKIPPGTARVPSGQRPNLFDTSIKVPLLVRWPGVIPPGSIYYEMVSHLDWLATMAEVAGPGSGREVKHLGHGRSMVGLWRGEGFPDRGFSRNEGAGFFPECGGVRSGERKAGRSDQAWRRELFAEYSMRHGATLDLRMVRTEKWKLVRALGAPERDELYHLEEDPMEERNLIASIDAKTRVILKQLDRKLRGHWAGLRKGASHQE
ncbi:MAG: hypothetical protein FJ404_00960 [Verrucomicrobia bacterium]|nr:hypothetical protein [Verrucomicrobiota bacterium]